MAPSLRELSTIQIYLYFSINGLEKMNRFKRNKIKGEFASIFEKVMFDDARTRGIDIRYEPVSFDYHKRAARGSKCGDCGGARILIPGKYTPDFCLNGRIYVEAKGYLDSKKRSLMEDFKTSNPTVDLRFIFKQNNWLTKAKKTKYLDWATKIGVPAIVGNYIPQTWVNEGLAMAGEPST